MKLIRFAAVLLLSVFVSAAFAEEEAQFVKVLVFESGTKPSVAMQKPQYEFRMIYKHGMKDPDLLCDKCRAKVYPEPPIGPILAGFQLKQGIAYLCLECKDLVWRDQGKQIIWSESTEMPALETLKRELSTGVPSSSIAKPEVKGKAIPAIEEKNK